MDDLQRTVDQKTKALLDRISEDNGRHGGLLDRQTIRAADELRIALAVRNRARQATPSRVEAE
jgi:hypothetical protein